MKPILIILSFFIGCILISCAAQTKVKTTLTETTAPETTTRSDNDFAGRVNALIAQLGDYDWNKRESASQEIKRLVDNFVGGITEDPQHLSPEMEYLIEALKYASENGQPPDTKRAEPNSAIKQRSSKLYLPLKYRLIVPREIINLHPSIIDELASDSETAVMNWLNSQPEVLQKKAIMVYTGLLKSTDSQIRRQAVTRLGQLIGKEAISDILPLLKDEDKEVRLGTIEILSNLKDSVVVKYLLPYLQDTNPDIRGGTIEALVKLGDKSVVKDITPLLQDSEAWIRRQTVWAMRRFGDPSAVNDLLPLLSDNDAEVRRATIIAASGLAGRNVIKDLLPLLKDDSAFVKREVLNIITSSGYNSILQEAQPDILTLLGDNDVEVRNKAISAISILNNKSNIKDIVPLLKDINPNVRLIAIRTLIGLGGPTAIKEYNLLDKLVSLLEYPETVILTMNTFREIKDPSVIAAIFPLLKGKNTSVRLDAIKTMITLGGVPTIREYSLLGELLLVLRDESAERRGEAIKIIVQLGDSSAVKDLVPLLKDDNEYVRSQVLYALDELGGKSIINEILPSLNDISGWIRLDTAKIIAKHCDSSALKDYSVTKNLLPLLESKDNQLRGSTIQVIGQIGDISAKNEVATFLNDKDEQVKWNAAWTLTKFGDIRAIPVWVEVVDEPQSFSIYSKRGYYQRHQLVKLADEGLTKLTGKYLTGTEWQDWWAKYGKAWYETELKKLEQPKD